MIIQNRDGSIAQEPGHRRLSNNKQSSYYAAVPAHLLDEQSNLIDRLIGFAFDTLGSLHLEVRVYESVERKALAHPEACC